MKTVLLVEDDSQITLALSIRLKSMGYKVALAGDAVSATAQAIKCKPDAIVLDINLPGGDGFLVAERMQKNHETSSIPFLFITANKRAGLEDRAKDLGAVALLEKPFDASQLAEALEKAINAEEVEESPFGFEESFV